jgi:Protein of unknown function DUF88.
MIAQDSANAGTGTPAPSLAVLIDAENVPRFLWPVVERLVHRLGRPSLVRAYACGEMSGWSHIDGIDVVDAGAAARGPNAADFLLAFDAGRIRESGLVSHFVLVTGDDGLAATVKALRESGATVSVIIPAVGGTYGRRLAQFADLCLLAAPPGDIVPVSATGVKPQTDECPFVAVLRQCIADSDGWVPLSTFGAALKAAGLSYKGKLFDVASSLPTFEIRGPKGVDTAVRLRRVPDDVHPPADEVAATTA